MPMKNFAIDAAPGLIKRETALPALTSTGYVGVQWDQGGPVATDFVCVVNIESGKVSSGNEKYTLRLVGSNEANRSDGQILAVSELGAAAGIDLETVDTVAGQQLVMRTRSERNDNMFRYVDLHLTVGGTAPSIAFGAHISKEF